MIDMYVWVSFREYRRYEKRSRRNTDALADLMSEVEQNPSLLEGDEMRSLTDGLFDD